MVDIVSKKSGPRREDVAAKRLIGENRQTIERLANHLSQGGYSAMRQPPKPPQPDGLVIHDLAARGAPATVQQPYVRVSLNGRVVVVDGETSKQLHFLGELRDGPEGRKFLLATRENRFFSPLEEDLSASLADFDHRTVGGGYSEEDLAAEIADRLGLT